jgi:hopanoid biosynthesis associated radical SAM protein HpnH
MSIPLPLVLSLGAYLASRKLRGVRRYPLVLMLEPTFRCNLSCAGCGRIREFGSVAARELSVAECLEACKEAGAPVVSITGGEPLLHRKIGEIVGGILGQRRFVHLCTNGLLLRRSLAKFHPSVRLSFVVHLDGLARRHDSLAGRDGVFETAVEAIREAKRAGFRVLSNTTVYRDSDPAELEDLLLLLAGLRVDGVMVSPAFNYEAVGTELSLAGEARDRIFRRLLGLRGRVPFYNTSPYLEFLAGLNELECKPWSTPTRSPMGWKQPCYLLTDRHFGSFRELMDRTAWERYGPGRDPRCESCKVHSGFEASAVARVLPGAWRSFWSSTLSRRSAEAVGEP